MTNYTKQVKEVMVKIPYNTIFIANELKNSLLREIPEVTYYKILERMTKEKELVHLTKGVYYRLKEEGDHHLQIRESIIQHYTSCNKGIVVGEELYERNGITQKGGTNIKILSTNMREDRKRLDNIEIQKLNIELNNDTIPVIETLEILQNFNKNDGINKNRFLAYMKKFSQNYSEDAVQYVIQNRKYKKSTIAFLERMLAWYGVENSLSRYLSPLSEYKVPTIEQLQPGVPEEMKITLDKYVLELQRVYKSYLHKVILYGSYARGDYENDSDVDIMILLKLTDMEIKDYRHKLSDITYDFNTNYNMDIKPIAKSKTEFEKWMKTYPFYANINREGIPLYDIA